MKNLLRIVLLYSMTSPLFATPQGWFIGLGAGAAFPQVNSYKYINTGSSWPADAYHFQTVSDPAVINAAIGFTWPTCKALIPYFNLAANFTYVSPSTLSGTIDQYSLPGFDNYHFSYDVAQKTFFLMFKADLYQWKYVMPFVNVGAGLTYNQTSDYRETPLNQVTARDSPGFGSKTATNLACTVGAGLDFVLQSKLLLSLEYRYGNFGSANTTHGNLGYGESRLNTKFNSNQLLLSANYYFDQV